MKRIFLIFSLIALTAVILVPALPAGAAALVPCGNAGETACTFNDLFVLLKNIYELVIIKIGIPLAGFLIILGGVCILISGLYPKLYDTGRSILWSAGIGLGLMLTSWLIVDLVLKALGYTADWWKF